MINLQKYTRVGGETLINGVPNFDWKLQIAAKAIWFGHPWNEGGEYWYDFGYEYRGKQDCSTLRVQPGVVPTKDQLRNAVRSFMEHPQTDADAETLKAFLMFIPA